MSQKVMDLKDIKKIFVTEELETTALNNINLSFNEGEFTAIIGPSGCGKSTLLSILGLLDQPTSGAYFFLGQNVAKASESKMADLRKPNLGFIFQSFNLIDELTVGENVALPLLYQGVPANERKARVKEVLDKVEMSHRIGHLPQQLSGGQQQRVSVARAVIGRPKVILADEPTGNLDSKNGEEVMNLLDQLHKDGATIVMVTHQPDFAERAQRIVKILDGHIVSQTEQGEES